MICTDKIPKPHTWPIPFFAHRGGALNRNEENSLAAFGRALDEKCPGIELDVHYVNGTVKVSHYKKYAAGKKAPAFEEALHFIHEKCRGQKIPKPIMNIDLKSKGVGEAVAEIIKKNVLSGKWRYTDFIITAFTRKNIKGIREKYIELKKVRSKLSRIPLGIIGARNSVKPYIKFTKDLNACSLNTKWGKGAVRRKYISEAHESGLAVYLWNVNTPEQMADALQKGVDGIITDDIDLAKKRFVVTSK